MNANIKRIFAELQADAKVQEMHHNNIEKRKAARERRRAAMLARMRKNQVAVYNDRESKINMMKMAFDKIGAEEAMNRVIENGNDELWNVAINAYEEHLNDELEMIRGILAARKNNG